MHRRMIKGRRQVSTLVTINIRLELVFFHINFSIHCPTEVFIMESGGWNGLKAFKSIGIMSTSCAVPLFEPSEED